VQFFKVSILFGISAFGSGIHDQDVLPFIFRQVNGLAIDRRYFEVVNGSSSKKPDYCYCDDHFYHDELFLNITPEPMIG
jgi:hypothetical protein